MRKRTSLQAFTLAEILVAMIIVAILALGISNINFSRLSQKQQINIETTKIITLIEEARNNALIGKGVGINLTTPESWTAEIENTSSSGSLIIRYTGASENYNQWTSPQPFSITNLECRQLDDTADTASGPFILTFTGSTGGITGCSNDRYKKINFDYGVGSLTQNISINTLSGIIEVN